MSARQLSVLCLICALAIACDSSSGASPSESTDRTLDAGMAEDTTSQTQDTGAARDSAQTLDTEPEEDTETAEDATLDAIETMDTAGPLDAAAPSPEVTLLIESPPDRSIIQVTSPPEFIAQIQAENIDPRYLAVYLESSLQGDIPTRYDPIQRRVTASLEGLESGQHTLTLTALAHPEYMWRASVVVDIRCSVETSFDEPLDESLWVIMGDAYREPDGWLEMTTQTVNSVGGIFLVGLPLKANQLDVSFRLAVEAELNQNAPLNEQISDGLAMTFWNIDTEQLPDLQQVLTPSGSKMGYGIYREQLAELTSQTGFTRPEAFTVEFDTYFNNCTRNPHEDPTPDPHVAITYDGYLIFPHHTTDGEGNSVEIPTSEVCNYPTPSDDPEHPWASIPELLDGAWHDVRITILQGQLTVSFDGQEVISSTVIAQRFKGGVLAFSGGSGAVPAHLKFDELSLTGECR